MALSGSLREFDLADIFQLLGQQKKTGRLVLVRKKEQSTVFFSWGEIVSAQSGGTTVTTMLRDYLIHVRGYPQSRIAEFLVFCKGNLNLFVETLARIQYLTDEEALSIIRMGVEDLTCELFFCKEGQYRFDPLDNVEDVRIPGVSYSTDAVCMEAMRRVDEWTRLQGEITPEGIYAPVQSDAFPGTHFPATDPEALVHSQLDGRISVEQLCARGFAARYRIYESLGNLTKSGRVTVSAAAASSGSSKRSSGAESKPLPVSKRAVAVILSIGVAGVSILLAMLLHFVILGSQRSVRMFRLHEISTADAVRKYATARTQYHTLYGIPAPDVETLSRAGMLHSRDISRLTGPTDPIHPAKSFIAQ